jgi:DNA-binding response OmpR family regulator
VPLEVLIVEDDDLTARVLARLMEGIGMRVSVAPTIATALAALTRKPPLIVLDLILPDGDGIDVLKAVRESGLKCHVAVVSAADNQELFERANALAANAVFTKPLHVGDFLNWISSIFTEPIVADGVVT